MVNTPMRPPTRTRSVRRPPRGPRTVPMRPTAKDIRTKELLEAASVRLRTDGEPEMAEAIDTVLSPKGWPMLGRLRAAEGEAIDTVNIPMKLSPQDRTEIKAQAERDGISLSDDVAEGLEAFINGEFVPVKPQRAARGSAASVVFNVRVAKDLADQATEYGKTLTDTLGWTPTHGTVARAWLHRRFLAESDTE